MLDGSSRPSRLSRLAAGSWTELGVWSERRLAAATEAAPTLST